MSRSSTRNYRGGPKNEWRRAVINNVLRRTGGREKKQVFLYLAALEANDLAILREKGVPHWNAIAVDRERDCVMAVRARGGLAIHGEITRVMASWSSTVDVCAVLIDLPCGLERSLIVRLMQALYSKPISSAVIVLNLLRGRDASSNKTRAGLVQLGVMKPNDLNRARMYVRFHAMQIIGADRAGVGRDGPVRLSDQVDYVEHRLFAPRYFSYASGSQRFDSVVFNSPATAMNDAHPNLTAYLNRLSSAKLKRAIAATLAVRTMRIEGTL